MNTEKHLHNGAGAETACSRQQSSNFGRSLRSRLRAWSRPFLLAALLPLLAMDAGAIPYYAWRNGLSCTDCHSVAPKLNAYGESFLARGYRMPAGVERDPNLAVPVSVWITGRHEDQIDKGVSETFVPKVELISGGPIAHTPLSYFVEWRVVSLETRSNGTLRDRGGRFEDVILNWEINDQNTFTIGQFRSLNQYDVSLRLSVSEPAIFSTSLRGDFSSDPRLRSVRAFSPSGRSPGVAYRYQSIEGPSSSDGLFHIVNLPFPGEFTLPLSDEARREASFEFEGEPKGVFLETFYRRRLNSIGAHAFLDDDRFLVTGVGRANYKDLHATAGVGWDYVEGNTSRMRYSFEVEYLPTLWDPVRPGVGFRVEQITNANREPAYIPYLVVAGPNTKFTLLLQLQYRFQQNNDALFLDVSALF